MDFTKPVADFIAKVGQSEASKYFEVSQALISSWASGKRPVTLKASQKLFNEKPELFGVTPPTPATMEVTAVEQEAPACPVEEVKVMPWAGKKILILSTTNRAPHWAREASLHKLCDTNTMHFHGITSNFLIRARNQLANYAMGTDAELVFWTDDDMVYQCGDGDWFRKTTKSPMPENFASINTIKRLMYHNKSLIGGCYFERNPNLEDRDGLGGRANFYEAKANREVNHLAHLGPRNEVRPTNWVATGCMLHTVGLLRDMAKKIPDIELPPEYQKAMGYRYNFFGEIKNQGEDASFCERARLIGHQPYVDMAVMPAHVGEVFYNYHNTKPKQLFV